jgi:hypothetical protein
MGGRRQLEQLTSSVPAIYELSLGSMSVQYGRSGWCATFLMRTPPAPACPPPTPPGGVCGRGVLFNDLGRPRWPPFLPACSAVLLTAVVKRKGRTSSCVNYPQGKCYLKCAAKYYSRGKFRGDSITYICFGSQNTT